MMMSDSGLLFWAILYSVRGYSG